jgi:hypothetical protein
MKLVENLGQCLGFLLFISSLSARFRRFRLLHGAGYLITGLCSVVFLEKILSPENIPWRSFVIIYPICFFVSWSDLLTIMYVFIYLCVFSRPFWHNSLTIQLSCGSHTLRSDTLSLCIYLFMRLFPSILTQQFNHPAIVWLTHITEWHFVIVYLLLHLCSKNISLKTSFR